jgi:hypothetical protein
VLKKSVVAVEKNHVLQSFRYLGHFKTLFSKEEHWRKKVESCSETRSVKG